MRAPVMLSVGLALLSCAWVFGTSPFSGPDEAAHYNRALGLLNGELVGDRDERTETWPGLSAKQSKFVRSNSRWVNIPAGMSPMGYPCNVQQPAVPANCHPPPSTSPTREATYTGNYLPMFYAAVAPALALTSGAVTANILGRLAAALISILLWSLAAGTLWSPKLGFRSVAGLLVATTPMSLYLMSCLTPSSFCVAGGLGVVAGLIALGREKEPPDRAWVTLAISGAALVLSRPEGVLYLFFDAFFFAVWVGPRRLSELTWTHRRQALRTASALIVTAGSSVGWTLKEGPNSALEGAGFWAALPTAVKQLPEWTRHQIGNFQYLDTPMPEWIYVTYIVLICVCLLTALIVGSRRDRAAVVGCLATVLIWPVVFDLFVIRPTEWGLQGRYVLPLTVSLPMIACEVIARNRRPRLPSRVGEMMWIGVAATMMLILITGWWVNSRRSSVGLDGPYLFWRAAVWSPPLGWWPWLAATVLGAGCVAIALFARGTGENAASGGHAHGHTAPELLDPLP